MNEVQWGAVRRARSSTCEHSWLWDFTSLSLGSCRVKWVTVPPFLVGLRVRTRPGDGGRPWSVCGT